MVWLLFMHICALVIWAAALLILPLLIHHSQTQLAEAAGKGDAVGHRQQLRQRLVDHKERMTRSLELAYRRLQLARDAFDLGKADRVNVCGWQVDGRILADQEAVVGEYVFS